MTLRWAQQNWLSRWALFSSDTNDHGLQASHEGSNDRIGNFWCVNERRHLPNSCKIQKPVTQYGPQGSQGSWRKAKEKSLY